MKTDEEKQELSEIILKIQNGDNSAFESFYKLLDTKLTLICISYIGKNIDVEDAVQDIYLTIIKNIHKYKTNDNPYGWVYQIARNKSIDILRERKRKQTVCLDAVNMKEHISHNKWDKYFIESIIHILEEDEQQILLLRYWNGYTFREIAKYLNQSSSTIERKTKKILNKLKEFIELSLFL